MFDKMNLEKDEQSSIIDQISSKANYVHQVHCDCCGERIEGVRYKCTVSKNLDFCPSCEEKVDHPYAFLKIYKQEQVPSAMFTVIDESMPDAHADIEQDVGDGPVPQLFGMPNPVPVEFKQEEDDEEDLYS